MLVTDSAQTIYVFLSARVYYMHKKLHLNVSALLLMLCLSFFLSFVKAKVNS